MFNETARKEILALFNDNFPNTLKDCLILFISKTDIRLNSKKAQIDKGTSTERKNSF